MNREESRHVQNSAQLDEAIEFLSSKISEKPAIAVVLGSGLGDFANQVSDPLLVDSHDIPHYPFSSVPGHEGKLVFGRIRANDAASAPLLVFKGRVHFYESGNLSTPIFPIKVAKALGVSSMIITNAAGGINPGFAAGDLMLITDFINLAFRSPRGSTIQATPPYYRVAHEPFIDKELSNVVVKAADRVKTKLHKGTYCWLQGPSYETKAEIEMLRRLGADAVGMSTVPELIAAADCGIRTAAISLISNLAAGLANEPLSHAEVSETASRVKQTFIALLTESLLSMKN